MFVPPSVPILFLPHFFGSLHSLPLHRLPLHRQASPLSSLFFSTLPSPSITVIRPSETPSPSFPPSPPDPEALLPPSPSPTSSPTASPRAPPLHSSFIGIRRCGHLLQPKVVSDQRWSLSSVAIVRLFPLRSSRPSAITRRPPPWPPPPLTAYSLPFIRDVYLPLLLFFIVGLATIVLRGRADTILSEFWEPTPWLPFSSMISASPSVIIDSPPFSLMIMLSSTTALSPIMANRYHRGVLMPSTTPTSSSLFPFLLLSSSSPLLLCRPSPLPLPFFRQRPPLPESLLQCGSSNHCLLLLPSEPFGKPLSLILECSARG